MSNHLPIRATKREETASWEFEWDEDALIYQAQACYWPAHCRALPASHLLRSPSLGMHPAMLLCARDTLTHVGKRCTICMLRLTLPAIGIHAGACVMHRMGLRTWISCMLAACQSNWIRMTRM